LIKYFPESVVWEKSVTENKSKKKVEKKNCFYYFTFLDSVCLMSFMILIFDEANINCKIIKKVLTQLLILQHEL
jgi:hypothetical protein